MKRGRPSTGGLSRNSDYYVKKFRPLTNNRKTIENYFQPTNNSAADKTGQSSTSNETVISDNNDDEGHTLNLVKDNLSIDVSEDISVLHSEENTIQPSNNTDTFCSTDVDIMVEDDNSSTANPTTNSESDCVTEDEEIECNTKSDEKIGQKYNAIDQKYITYYEKEYKWLYYSHSLSGFLCKLCSLLSNNGPDKPWESVGVDIKKNGHPTRVCRKHELSKRHKQAVAAQEIREKKGIQKSIYEGAEAANQAKISFNRKLISKFIKILYFMIKKQWAISENFESLVRFLGENLEDQEIKKHLESCGKNATYLSHISVENMVSSISFFVLEQELLTKLASAVFFTLMADECTDQSQREQLGLIVRYRLPGNLNVQEKYFGLVHLNDCTAEGITKAIEKICIAKNIDVSKCLFISLDGANVMSGEHSGVQRRIKHLSPHCIYINCRNHKLALVFVHLLKKYEYLKAVDCLLVSLWKLFHYSPKKAEVFKEIQQNVYRIEVLKVLKVSTTRWLSHGRACGRVSARYEQLLETLDTLFSETREPELKGLREQLLDPKVLLTVLFLADFLEKVNVLNLWLQSQDVTFSLIQSKVDNLVNEVEAYCKDLDKGHYFQRSEELLNLANDCTTLSTKFRRGKVLSKKDVLKEFKEKFVKNFLEDFKSELLIAFDISHNSSALKGFDIFSNIHLNEIEDDKKEDNFDEGLSHLISYYGEQKEDNFQDVATLSEPIIDKVSIESEKKGFKNEILLSIMNFNITKTKKAQQFIRENKKDEAKHAMSRKMSPNDLQTALEKSSENWRLYPNNMKLLSLATIMPSSTASVERLFSRLNLLCTDLRTSLKQESLDRQLRIIVNGPKKLSEPECNEIINIFKGTGNRRILL